MKGTLFTADFINDGSNLRLLEFNTDTAFTSGALHNTDFSEFINLLSSSNITEVDVIYKEIIHQNFVTELSQSLHNSDLSVTYNLHKETYQTIYPTAVADAANKFILRLAYDESAIFDGTYCKQDDELMKLFHDNNDSDSVVELYLSSSNSVIDTLQRTENPSNLPDVVVKNFETTTESLKFYKLQGTGSFNEKVDSFVSSSITTGSYVMNFYHDTGSTYSTSYRSFNIIYGTELNLLNLATIEVDSLFEKPASMTIDHSLGGVVDVKHYYEYTTNFPTFAGVGGIFQEEEIVDVDGNAVKVKDLVIGNRYKSSFISGSPDSDDVNVISEWSYAGSSLPSGSYTTSSLLVNNIGTDLTKNLIHHVGTSNGASFRINPGQDMLTYNVDSDSLQYKNVHTIDINSDRLLDITGSLVPISYKNIEVLDGDYKTYNIDLEDTDTFLLYNANVNLKLITHNACFPIGTKISLADGTYKNIEDINTTDVLLTYNNKTNEYGAGKIGSIEITTQSILIQITTTNGEVIKATPKHRIYTQDGYKPISELAIGDSLFNKDGLTVKVSEREELTGEFDVYHLIDVKDDHTYFAEDILVHNIKVMPTCFSAGTRITLSDHNEKFIEDVEVGDEVLGWDGEKLIPAKVIATDRRHTVGDSAKSCETLGEKPSLFTINEIGIEFTAEHPFYTKDGWKSLVPDVNQEPYKSEQEPKVLGIGDFIFVNEEWEEIKEIRVVRSDSEETVYNLTVEGVHSYLADGVLVHNK
jgi:hypothetical protein